MFRKVRDCTRQTLYYKWSLATPQKINAKDYIVAATRKISVFCRRLILRSHRDITGKGKNKGRKPEHNIRAGNDDLDGWNIESRDSWDLPTWNEIATAPEIITKFNTTTVHWTKLSKHTGGIAAVERKYIRPLNSGATASAAKLETAQKALQQILEDLAQASFFARW